MRIDRALSRSVHGALALAGARRPARSVSILMYHSISAADESDVTPYYRVATSPGRFRQHLTLIRDLGYDVISLTDAVKRLRTEGADIGHAVVLTFDDGYRDFMLEAWPLLWEFGWTATVFLPTAFIGSTARRCFKSRECLTWAEVRQLSDHGIEFGAHTVSHAILHRLPWSDVRRELRESRRHIEDALHTRTSTFAYPYAFPQEDSRFAARLNGELTEQGFDAMVTTIIGRALPGSDVLCLRRLPMNDADDSTLVRAKLDGAYDWLRPVQFWTRRLKALADRRGMIER